MRADGWVPYCSLEELNLRKQQAFWELENSENRSQPEVRLAAIDWSLLHLEPPPCSPVLLQGTTVQK